MHQPALVSGKTLFPYQLDAVKWLSDLHRDGKSGILGDEMGLGKTLTSVALIGWIMETQALPGPFLIVAPLTLVDTWMSEFKASAPAVKVQRYIGSKEEREEIREDIVNHILSLPKTERKNPSLTFNVLVTTYDLVINDIDFLKKFKWKLLVVDEGHRLKNAQSVLFRTLDEEMKLNCMRLILTGTPMQNNLEELWSLLKFCDAATFPSYESFTVQFKNPKNKEAETKALKELLKPYILRREKKHVNLCLPSKKEAVVRTGLTSMQRTLYRSLLLRNTSILEAGGSGGTQGLSNVVMNLRKACNHPYLFEGMEPEPFEEGDHLWMNSGKLVVLDRLLAKLRAKNHKVLIFSQMTRVLDIIQDYLQYRSYPYERLDGSVRGEERFLAVQNYANQKESFVFLLSTRAGGQGLNLTTADTVIFFDSDWNPQRDLQAQQRVHRIGQTKPVLILRFVTEDTLEEIILRRAAAKLQFAENIIGGGTFVGGDKDGDKDADGNNSGASKEDLWLAIQYGVAKLFASEEPILPDVDVNEILRREVQSESSASSAAASSAAAAARGEGGEGGEGEGGEGEGEGGDTLTTAQRNNTSAMEISTYSLDEAESQHASLYTFEGEDYSNVVNAESSGSKDEREEDVATLKKILEEKKRKDDLMQKESSSTRKRASPSGRPSMSKEELKQKADEKKKKKWEAEGYVSLALLELDDGEDEDGEEDHQMVAWDDGDEANIERTQSKDLILLMGDACKPHVPPDAPAVILCSVDDSGVWCSAGFFRAISAAFGSLPKQAYENAKKFSDLKVGDVHLVPCGEDPVRLYVALMVVQKRNKKDGSVSEVLLDALNAALPKLSRAARKLNASIHSPRLASCSAGPQWYSVQRMMRKYLSARRVPTYIYYYSRTGRGASASAAPPSPATTATRAAAAASSSSQQQNGHCSVHDIIGQFPDIGNADVSDDEYDDDANNDRDRIMQEITEELKDTKDDEVTEELVLNKNQNADDADDEVTEELTIDNDKRDLENPSKRPRT